MLDIYITMRETDGKALYDELKQFNLNVTDFASRTFIYGRLKSENEFEKVVAICNKYGIIEE